MTTADPRVIVALDFPDGKTALDLTDRLQPALCRVKVGNELFTAAGPAFVEKLVRRGFGVFLDLKYHDIPNTVASACKAAHGLGVWMINVHALGGRAMMQAARDALHGPDVPKLIAVTVLTSMADADLYEVGVSDGTAAAVPRLASLAKDCGLDGVVCSPLEASALRITCGPAFCLVTPGIRPAAASTDDQQRISTPERAIANGAHYLVVGRPITRAVDPPAALERIHEEISHACAATK